MIGSNNPSITATKNIMSYSVNYNFTKDQIVIYIQTEGSLSARCSHFRFLSQGGFFIHEDVHSTSNKILHDENSKLNQDDLTTGSISL